MESIISKDIKAGLARAGCRNSDFLTSEDLACLPPIVQKYLHYTGFVGKPKVHNMNVTFKGRIRSSAESEWAELNASQYRFFDVPTRLFYINTQTPKEKPLMHNNIQASVNFTVSKLFSIVDDQAGAMDQAETVTLLKEMCVMAPATLANSNIKWDIIDDLTVKATFRNGDIIINALLFFNEQGQLVNFASSDCYEAQSEYKEQNGIRLATKTSLICHKPVDQVDNTADNSQPANYFCYGEFVLYGIQYNCQKIMR